MGIELGYGCRNQIYMWVLRNIFKYGFCEQCMDLVVVFGSGECVDLLTLMNVVLFILVCLVAWKERKLKRLIEALHHMHVLLLRFLEADENQFFSAINYTRSRELICFVLFFSLVLYV